jgi:hypothetical protein
MSKKSRQVIWGGRIWADKCDDMREDQNSEDGEIQSRRLIKYSPVPVAATQRNFCSL